MQIYKTRSYWYFFKSKVLSSEMDPRDPSEIRLIRKVVIEERGAEVF